MHEAVWTREDGTAILDDPGRYEAEDPKRLWERAGLAPGMCVVDIGAGTGFYAFPASERVGRTGRVYAVDVSPELVELVRERARQRRRGNVEAVLSRPQRIPLANALADRVLLANVVHGIPPATLGEAVRVLRPGGRLLDLDWKKEAGARGPPLAHRLSVAAARRTLERYGLRGVGEWDFGPDHYLVMLEKPATPSPRRARPRPASA